MSTVISVQLDRVAALAAELAALASALDDDAALCTSTAGSLRTALGGTEGWQAGGAGVAWARVTGILAARTDAVAATLTAALDGYRAADTALAHRVGAGLPGASAVAR